MGSTRISSTYLNKFRRQLKKLHTDNQPSVTVKTIIKLMSNHKYSIDLQTLFIAIKYGACGVLKSFIKDHNKYLLNQFDYNGTSALIYAFRNGKSAIIDHILGYNEGYVDFNQGSWKHGGALHYAVWNF